jgi:hypothetical protein
MLPSSVKPINYLYFALIILLIFLARVAVGLAAGPQLVTGNSSLITRVAPGEFLPITVKLTNFGSAQRVDVTITYQILNQTGAAVLTSTDETVAVETTASFVKIIQIPYDLAPGTYIAESSIFYQGQNVPAIGNYQFTVESKIAGIFLSDFITYAIITILIGLIFAVVSRLIMKKRRPSRFSPQEYPEIPSADRIFYEIISDIIMQMHYRLGHKARNIVKNTSGLVVNQDGDRVLAIENSPAQIIAQLVAQYEKISGQKMSFVFQSPEPAAGTKQAKLDKKLVVIRKYPNS